MLFIWPSRTYYEIFKTQSYSGKYICRRQTRNNVIVPIAAMPTYTPRPKLNIRIETRMQYETSVEMAILPEKQQD